MPHDDHRKIPTVLNKQTNWNELYFYQKADVVYQLSFVFCERFIHLYKDRTRDQVIQAARSCKQNIVEGLADGVTSTEMQLKLLNVARSSLKELKEDFEDFLKSRHLRFYTTADKEYDPMLQYCRMHNKLEDYEPFFLQWTDEEMCNYGVTLCHMIDKMMMTFLERLDREFVTQGGIKERMYRARTGYRQQQDERLKQLEAENPQLHQRIAELEAQLAGALQASEQWQAAYNDLKQRALNAYNKQKEEIEELKRTR
ncbi:MAG: four helix bundle suffix domain-containing protein [Bacteroidales bacterium]|nr:four helix bundle suffix domain-containing protein [Bacteroidales bacterium]